MSQKCVIFLRYRYFSSLSVQGKKFKEILIQFKFLASNWSHGQYRNSVRCFTVCYLHTARHAVYQGQNVFSCDNMPRCSVARDESAVKAFEPVVWAVKTTCGHGETPLALSYMPELCWLLPVSHFGWSCWWKWKWNGNAGSGTDPWCCRLQPRLIKNM